MSTHRDIECPVCHATPANMDIRIITGSVEGGTTETRHTEDCPRQERGAQLRLVRPDEEPPT